MGISKEGLTKESEAMAGKKESETIRNLRATKKENRKEYERGVKERNNIEQKKQYIKAQKKLRNQILA